MYICTYSVCILVQTPCNTQSDSIFPLTSHIGEATQQQGQEQIKDDEISYEDGSQKIGYTGGPSHIHTVPHGFDPLPTEDSEHNHETVHEVREVPSGQFAIPLFTNFVSVVFAKELHAHHSKDEDDNAKDEGQVGQGAHRVGHDCQDVIERLPRFGQFEDAKQTEGSKHGQAFDTLSQQLDQGQYNDQEVEAIPSILYVK